MGAVCENVWLPYRNAPNARMAYATYKSLRMEMASGAIMDTCLP